MLSRMAPSSPPKKRTLHLLNHADILCANDKKYLDGYLKNIIEFVYIDRNVTESSGDCIPCMAHGVSTVPSMRRVTSDTQSWERVVVLGLASN